ncbi:uncharacterized protein PAC_10807 [Phialocephala subalpina]|uniref:Uncharacterized protein n=1 Tax=Phialocephala subalpina TaxID=576137 RepID=A0A1L7X7A8_9HELO|nr:uncharacterized protein PAC_10807 [Phialocephala subalpina]
MSDTPLGQADREPDLGIAITTEEGKKVAWKPRPHVPSLWPTINPGPTPANSPSKEQALGGGLSRPFDTMVERGANAPFTEPETAENREGGVKRRSRDGAEKGEVEEEECKKTKVRDRLRHLKSKFTQRLKADSGSKRRGTMTQHRGLDPTLYIIPNKTDETTPQKSRTIMKSIKNFCRSVKAQKPRAQSGKTSESVTRASEQAPFTHSSGTTSNRCVKSCSEQTPFTNLPHTPSVSDSNFNSRSQQHGLAETSRSRSCSLSSTNSTDTPRRRPETISSMSCQSPSLLDSPRIQRSRLIEQRANDMITASLSTSPEGSGHRNPKANCNHQGWRWCCKCNVKRERRVQQEGNTDIPRDAQSLTTYSDESDESLVNVVVDSPVIEDDSLVRMKTYDLHVLDSVLMERSQKLQIDNQNRVLQLPGAAQLRQSTNNLQLVRCAQIQRSQSNVETNEYHRLLAQIERPTSPRRHTDSEMPQSFETGRLLMDDEISELNIPGPAHPSFIGRQLGALAAQLQHLPKLNISLSGHASKSTASPFEQQAAAVKEMNEKLLSVKLDENMEASVYQETEDKLKERQEEKLEEALKEAINTTLDEPSLKQISAEHNLLDNASNHSQPISFTTARSSTSISGDASAPIAINKGKNRQSTNTLASSYVDVFHDACSSPTYPPAPPSSPSSEHIPEEYNLAFVHSPTYPAAPPSSPNVEENLEDYHIASRPRYKPRSPTAPPNSPNSPNSEDNFEDYHIAATASPIYPVAPPSSPHSIKAKSPRSSDLRVWNYPTLDSSATSLDFGFHPTLETMPGSWPEKNGFVTVGEPDIESEEGQEGRSWRDFDTGLPMGRVH